MNMKDLKLVCKSVAMRLRADAVVLDMLMAVLPELPEGADYVAVSTDVSTEIARLIIDITVKERRDVIPLTKLLPPVPMVKLKDEIMFRAETETVRGEEIYPVVFTASVNLDMEETNDGRFGSMLTWFIQPFPIEPDIRLIVRCLLMEDFARVYSNSSSGLPVGICIEDDATNRGVRNVTVFWKRDVEDWEQVICDEAYWPDTID